jgi:hypothetical protein
LFRFDDEWRALQQSWLPAEAIIEPQFFSEWVESALLMAALCA